MKKFSFLVMIIIFVMMFPGKGQAASGHSNIYLDGTELVLATNAKIETMQNNIMIPVRVVVENLGFNVAWDKNKQSVTINNDSTVIHLVVNNKSGYVNGNKVTLPIGPALKTDTVLVPIRFVSEQLGLQVNWDNASKKIYLISSDTGSGNPGTKPEPNPDPGTEPTTPGELALINSISYSENRLMIATKGSIEPKATVMSSPNRIVIDIPYAKFSETFGTSQQLDSYLQGSFHVVGYPDLYQVRYSLYNNSPSTVRIVMDLNYAKVYTIHAEGNLLVVELKTTDPSNPGTPVGGNGKKIAVIDAGHGNQDPGAIGITGKKEKAFNLAVALKVDQLLKNEPKIEGVLTRNNDTFLELKERVKIANDLNADVFISIHANSSGSSAASGTETYYNNDRSKALANVMHKYLVRATGFKDRGVRYGNFHVIRETKMAAVLLESGYLSNKQDEAGLFTESLQNRVAQGIVDGIKEYFGLE
ncbi:N-acetylmuramoyl-L-alanine amidase family protein [Paenibacillus glacialis]|uniref:N-acetylmuramoyl-L-alanine amidase n=1 Tax=Paenibacillus glacialis TaxID=494026 RepID=A0A168MES0_9BACL|nr:N-acetylmuramoyl-L-alanine amidase family protein [Paenibacillus glacialis]OAB44592.1 N-acetylmuramoyl-L-alanine amidase [Paenibacillus glacialis]